MKELIERWKTKSPIFWVKIKNLAFAFGGSALSVWTLNTTLSLQLPQIILDICKYVLVAAAAVGFSAKLTKE